MNIGSDQEKSVERVHQFHPLTHVQFSGKSQYRIRRGVAFHVDTVPMPFSAGAVEEIENICS